MKEKLIPESLRPALKREITDVCYVLLLSISQADWAAAQGKGRHSRIFGEIEDRFEDFRTSIDTIQTLWPQGKSKLKNLTNLAKIMPDWLSNYRSWQEFVDLHDVEVSNSQAARKAYQAYVESNRKYMTQIDYETAQVASELSSVGLNFQQIVTEAIERISNSNTTREARTTAQGILDEVVRSGRLTSDQAVKQLAKYLELPSSEIDISTFDLGQCAQVLMWGQLAKLGI